jgi:hypothetical protein
VRPSPLFFGTEHEQSNSGGVPMAPKPQSVTLNWRNQAENNCEYPIRGVFCSPNRTE